MKVLGLVLGAVCSVVVAGAPAAAGNGPQDGLAARVAAFGTDGAKARLTERAAGGFDKTICESGATSDPSDVGGVLDISFASIDRDCDLRAWGAYVETYDAWEIDQLEFLGVLLDTDRNAGNGCGGIDLGVSVGRFEGDGVVVRIPSCDDSQWTIVSTDVTIGSDDPHNVWLLVPEATVGAANVRGVVTLASVSGSIDDAPDAGVITTDRVNDQNPLPQPQPQPSTDQPGSFSNGRCTIPFSERATNNSVARLYNAYFLRPADGGGLAYWVPKYRSGQLCLGEISEFFSQSQEFVSRYGLLDNPSFVRLVYVNVLGREPDAAGYNYWAQQITFGGMRRGTMMIGFSESPEFRARTGLP